MSPESSASSLEQDMFRPPLNRTMTVLDRSLFSKPLRTVAAVINDNSWISRVNTDLLTDALNFEGCSRIQSIQPAHGQEKGKKCMILKPDIKKEDPSTWSPRLAELVASRRVELEPWTRQLSYDDWTYADIMSSILPLELQEDGVPQGFTTVGHVAHFNLREPYLPYKHIIGAVILDKLPNIRTVVNKIDDVGKHDPYRTFNYEVIAGENNLAVEVKEQECIFHFDYSKVYWNSRLETEHRRLVNLFNPGEAIADVMAGVGPFAVPAAKKRCFVYANDLNPASFLSLQDASQRNKVAKSPSYLAIQPQCGLLTLTGGQVTPYARLFSEDGHHFIRSAADDIFHVNHVVEMTPPSPRQNRDKKSELKPVKRTYLRQPKIFAHYVLNLPDSALTFLSAFIGLHASRYKYFAANRDIKLPMVHVYCFIKNKDDSVNEEELICKEISRQIGFEMRPGKIQDEVGDGVVDIFDVRLVAPGKRMFCASFRLPAKVAFADRPA